MTRYNFKAKEYLAAVETCEGVKYTQTYWEFDNGVVIVDEGPTEQDSLWRNIKSYTEHFPYFKTTAFIGNRDFSAEDFKAIYSSWASLDDMAPALKLMGFKQDSKGEWLFSLP